MFKIHQPTAESFQYTLENNQWKVFLQSGIFVSRDDTLDSIESLKKYSSNPWNISPAIDTDGKHYFTILGKENEIAWVSILYDDIEQRDRCIRYVLNHTPTATVVEV